eukprot:TRINITY_DN4582_c0_g3_i1.p1 TRINITY_DN4582_c0_g3~~TRINITY_DN4582_c0_g3_i1.p1  ORF type:complete len:317 (+),score=102.16 TRINITY_DN4582_c0_g3_i1:231-1181(+)
MSAAPKLAGQPGLVPKGPYLITAEVLGSGSTGKVLLALRKRDMTRIAVKVVTKSNKVKEEACREIQLLLQLNHKNIIKIEHLDEDDKFLYIFMEYLDQGDLFSYIQRHGPLTENHARILFKQMAGALQYCHSKRICHHDFKLENCVINRHLELRVIDFAYAMLVPPGSKITRFPGSPAYSAPEVLFRKPHGVEIDLFSLGTSLYYMLACRFPFCDEEKTSFQELCRNVREFKLSFPKHMSEDVCDLIRRMLAPERIGWSELTQHPWFTKQHLPSTSSPLPLSSPSTKSELSQGGESPPGSPPGVSSISPAVIMSRA